MNVGSKEGDGWKGMLLSSGWTGGAHMLLQQQGLKSHVLWTRSHKECEISN